MIIKEFANKNTYDVIYVLEVRFIYIHLKNFIKYKKISNNLYIIIKINK